MLVKPVIALVRTEPRYCGFRNEGLLAVLTDFLYSHVRTHIKGLGFTEQDRSVDRFAVFSPVNSPVKSPFVRECPLVHAHVFGRITALANAYR